MKMRASILVLSCTVFLSFAKGHKDWHEYRVDDITSQTHNVEFHEHESHSHVRSTNGGKYQVVSKTYLSQPIPLLPGEMVYTQPKVTPIQMPEGKFAILGFVGDIVQQESLQGSNVSYTPAPLSSLYDHHWIVVAGDHQNQLCGPKYLFGIGAESRNTPVSFPDGYGYIVDEKTWFGANIHLLHTEDLEGENVHKAAKECNECYYAKGKGSGCSPKLNGTFQCCGESCFSGDHSCRCPTRSGASTEQTVYYLRYTLTYTKEIESVQHLNIGVITTPNCQAFYDVLRNDSFPEQVASTEFPASHDAVFRFAAGHQHTGALNISLFKNDEYVCSSHPQYGSTLGKAGDEKGYLVKMSICIGKEGVVNEMVVKKGDILRLDSWYYAGSEDPRLLFSDGTHLNVMGYFYTAYTIPDDANVEEPFKSAMEECYDDLVKQCVVRGKRWPNASKCFSCARKSKSLHSSCNSKAVAHICSKMF